MNIPVLSFLKRNVALLAAFVVFFLLFKNEEAFQAAGPIIYLPVLFAEAVIVALIVRHFFWRKTVDEFAHSGDFQSDWRQSISAAERVRWTIGITLTLILCASIIAAALAK